MVGCRFTRFCLPLINIVSYSARLRRLAAFSAAESSRLRFLGRSAVVFLP